MCYESIKNLSKLILRQLYTFCVIEPPKDYEDLVESAYYKAKEAFSSLKDKYYGENGFSPLNSVHYAIFLYYISNLAGLQIVEKEKHQSLASVEPQKLDDKFDELWNLKTDIDEVVTIKLGKIKLCSKIIKTGENHEKNVGNRFRWIYWQSFN